MERRGLFLGLAALAATLTAAVPAEAQPGWGGPPPGHRGRRRRCWVETRQIRYRDRWGRVRWRTVQRQVCR